MPGIFKTTNFIGVAIVLMLGTNISCNLRTTQTTQPVAVPTALVKPTETQIINPTATPEEKMVIQGMVFYDIDHNFEEGIAYGIEAPYNGNFFFIDESKLRIGKNTSICASYQDKNKNKIKKCSDIGSDGKYILSILAPNYSEEISMIINSTDFLNWTLVNSLESTEFKAPNDRTIRIPVANVLRVNDEPLIIDTEGEANINVNFAVTKTDLIVPIPAQFLHHVHEIGLFDRNNENKITQIFTGESFTHSNCTIYQNSLIPNVKECYNNHPGVDFFVDDDSNPSEFTNNEMVPVINPYMDTQPYQTLERNGPDFGNYISIPTYDNAFFITIHHQRHFNQQKGIFEIENGVTDFNDGSNYGEPVGIISNIHSYIPQAHPHIATVERGLSPDYKHIWISHDPIMENISFEKEMIEQINNKYYSEIDWTSNVSIRPFTIESFTLPNGYQVLFAPNFPMQDANKLPIEIPRGPYKELIPD